MKVGQKIELVVSLGIALGALAAFVGDFYLKPSVEGSLIIFAVAAGIGASAAWLGAEISNSKIRKTGLRSPVLGMAVLALIVSLGNGFWLSYHIYRVNRQARVVIEVAATLTELSAELTSQQKELSEILKRRSQ